MEPILGLLSIPVLFILPGLWPARLVTGRLFSGVTIAWAMFFSVVLMPPLCFGLAMLLGTTMNFSLTVAVALALGVPGLWRPGRRSEAKP